jgi:hypothetical protein
MHEVQHVTVLPLHSVATQLWMVCCTIIHCAAVVPNVLLVVLLVQGCLMVTDIPVVVEYHVRVGCVSDCCMCRISYLM